MPTRPRHVFYRVYRRLRNSRRFQAWLEKQGQLYGVTPEDVFEEFLKTQGLTFEQVEEGLGVPPVPTPPSVIDPPTIPVNAIQGSVIAANAGRWLAYPFPSFTFQWRLDNVDINGATDSTYLVAQSSGTLSVAVTATNSEGSATAVSNDSAISVGPVLPANVTPPAVPVSASEGTVLNVTPGTWTGSPTPTLSYQWRRDGSAISGATNTSYTVVAADLNATLTVVETATNSEGSVQAVSNGCAVGAYTPANADAWYDVQDVTTLFQDEAGTQPVTADGQKVRRIEDKSGNGLHATGAVGGTVGTSPFGFRYIHFADATEALSVSLPQALSDYPTLAVAQRATDGETAYGIAVGDGSINQLFALRQFDNTGPGAVAVNGGVNASRVSPATLSVGHVALVADGVNDAGTVNGLAMDTTALPALPALDTLYIGSNPYLPGGSPNPGACEVYSAVYFSGGVDANERNDLTSWLETQCPVSRIKGMALFATGGQSNQEGQAIDTGASVFDSGVWQMTKDGVVEAAFPLDNDDTPIAGTMSMEAEFCNAYQSTYGQEVLILPRAKGGAGINGNWLPTQSLFERLVTMANETCVLYSQTVDGAIFQNGEADTSALTGTLGADEITMINGLRSDCVGMSATTPFMLGLMPDDFVSANGARPAYQQELWDIQLTTEGVAVFDTTSPVLATEDGLHYNEAAQIAIGLGKFSQFSDVRSGTPVLVEAPAVPANAGVGDTITVTPGAYVVTPALTYAWYRDGVATGVTGPSYTTSGADEGTSITVRETATVTGTLTTASSGCIVSSVQEDAALVDTLGGVLWDSVRGGMAPEIDGSGSPVVDAEIGYLSPAAGIEPFVAGADAERLVLRETNGKQFLEMPLSAVGLVANGVAAVTPSKRWTVVLALRIPTGSASTRYFFDFDMGADTFRALHQSSGKIQTKIEGNNLTTGTGVPADDGWAVAVMEVDLDSAVNLRRTRVYENGVETGTYEDTAVALSNTAVSSGDIAIGGTLSATLSLLGGQIAYVLVVPGDLGSDLAAIVAIANSRIPV